MRQCRQYFVNNNVRQTHRCDLRRRHGHVDMESAAYDRFLACGRSSERTCDLPSNGLGDAHVVVEGREEYERVGMPANVPATALIVGMDIVRVCHEARRQGNDMSAALATHQPAVRLDVLAGVCGITVAIDECADIPDAIRKAKVEVEEGTVETLREQAAGRALAGTSWTDQPNGADLCHATRMIRHRRGRLLTCAIVAVVHTAVLLLAAR